MLYKHDIEIFSNTIVGKTGFASHRKPTAEETQ